MLFDFVKSWPLSVTVSQHFHNQIFEIRRKISARLYRNIEWFIGSFPGLPKGIVLLANDVLIQNVVNWCTSVEGHSSCGHNKKNNSSCKNIYTSSSIGSLFNKFRCHVILSANSWIHNAKTIISLFGYWQSKISYFQLVVLVKQQIFNFQVPMNNLEFLVQIFNCVN